MPERKTKRAGDKIQCWKCGLDLKETSIFFCDCANNVVLPPPEKDFFSLLDRWGPFISAVEQHLGHEMHYG